jgi:superfamily II DNA or RNA helicase
MQISQRVRVRGARWRIADIRPFEACQLLTLAGASSSRGVVEQQVLAPFDDVEPFGEQRRARFASANRWWHTCRTLIADNTPPGGLQCPHRAGIELMPHQLEPALAIVRGLGSRLLLADEVGLGKTIQAGIVLAELRTRGLADRILVLAPAGLRDQWIEELAGRFDLGPLLADAASLRRISATIPLGVNPWLTLRIAVASLDYVKRPEVLPLVLACPWDTLVVDEAHAAAGDSDRQAAVASIASRAAYVLLLTATPHNGDDRTFASLCRFGASGDELVVFRRRKADVRPGAIRKIHVLHTRSTVEELRVHQRLQQYVVAVSAESDAAWLAASVLHKRAMSSAWSLARTVERRLASLANPIVETASQPGLPFDDRDGELAGADDEPVWPAGVGLSDPLRERRLLRGVATAARAAAVRESKMNALARLLRRTREPAIVFTEYRDTLLHVRSVLGQSAAILHGGLSRAERTTAVDEFVRGRCPLLLATDVGAEGLNLQHGCRLVINLELPWNPMRLEQRIGRVDRIGQRRTVHAFHLVAAGTGEDEILRRLKLRVARAQAEIGAPDPFGAIEEFTAARHIVCPPRAGVPTARGVRLGVKTGVDGEPPEALKPELVFGTVPRKTPDLGDDSRLECHRLGFARVLLGRTRLQGRQPRRMPATASDADGPMIARVRRAALRRALGRRVLTVWQVAHENGSSRIVESTLVPVAIDLARIPRRWSKRAVDGLFKQYRRVGAVDLIEQSAAGWRDSADRSIRALFTTRLARERAIIALVARSDGVQVQAGLFDRRAERARQQAVAASLDAESERQERLAALHLSATISAARPQLLLVLLPR